MLARGKLKVVVILLMPKQPALLYQDWKMRTAMMSSWSCVIWKESPAHADCFMSLRKCKVSDEKEQNVMWGKCKWSAKHESSLPLTPWYDPSLHKIMWYYLPECDCYEFNVLALATLLRIIGKKKKQTSLISQQLHNILKSNNMNHNEPWNVEKSAYLTLYTLTGSLCIFSILFSIHYLSSNKENL